MMRIKKTKTTTEEKTRGIRDLLFKMLVSAVIGGILGLLIGYLHFSQQGDLPAFTPRWLALIQGLILPGLLIITLLSIILQESIFRKLKEVSGLLEAAEDEDFHRLDYEEERIGALLVGANVMSQVLCIVLFSFGYSFDYLKDLPALSSCLVFIICFVYCGCMQARYIQLTQAVHPEKKGNVASRKFRQQWLESCDEAEKEIIYQSAYGTLRPCEHAPRNFALCDTGCQPAFSYRHSCDHRRRDCLFGSDSDLLQILRSTEKNKN